MPKTCLRCHHPRHPNYYGGCSYEDNNQWNPHAYCWCSGDEIFMEKAVLVILVIIIVVLATYAIVR